MNVGGSLQAEHARAVRGAAVLASADGWERTPLPDPGAAFLLSAVAAPYAVGATSDGPLVQRWTGIEWRNETVPVLPPGGRGATLTGVGPDGVAVGGWFDPAGGSEEPLLLHRTDTGWIDAGPPDLGFGYVLTAVRAGWAVGHGFPATVLLRRDGPHWRRVPVPGRPLRPLAVAVHGTDLWISGARDRDGLIVRFDGRSWKEFRTGTGAVTVLTASAAGLWGASGATLLRWTGRRWSPSDAPFPVNALTTTAGGLTAAGAGEAASFDGRSWTIRELPGTWLGADENWLVGSV
ncbi:hypothetical protein [Actinocorallia longicatena]|uniref:LigA protein n=1 Tax=Actinocorallia longicatena TaxID=111803 RepID=A0ABP6QC61_9ACTN